MNTMTNSLRMVAAAALFLPVTALAQGAPARPAGGVARSLGVTLSLTSVHMKDEYLSPLIYRGWIPSAAVSAWRSAASSRQELYLSFGVGHIDSHTLPRDVSEHLGELTYTYMRAVGTATAAGARTAIFVGGGVSSTMSFTDFDATDPSSGYTYFDRSWYWSHALNVEAEAEYRAGGRGRLVAHFSAPVVRLVSRPKNGHDFNASNARVIHGVLNAARPGPAVGLWQDPAMACRLAYRQRLGTRGSLEVGYAFAYATSSTPMALHMYTEGFHVGLAMVR